MTLSTAAIIKRELLAKAAEDFGGVCPPELAALVARGLVRSETVSEDLAAFVAATGVAVASGTPAASAVGGVLLWTEALEASSAVQAIHRDHRGALLVAFECAAESPVSWATSEGHEAIAALLKLLVYEERQAIADRHGMSFSVFESHCAALVHATPQVLSRIPDRVERLLAQPWHEVRHAPLAGLGLEKPASVSDVPFSVLCQTRPHPIVTELEGIFVTQAKQDIRLYDLAPLAVAEASVLLAALLRRGPLDTHLIRSLPTLARQSWSAVLDALARPLPLSLYSEVFR